MMLACNPLDPINLPGDYMCLSQMYPLLLFKSINPFGSSIGCPKVALKTCKSGEYTDALEIHVYLSHPLKTPRNLGGLIGRGV